MDVREEAAPQWFTAVVVGLLVAFVALSAFAFRGTLLPRRDRVAPADARIVALAAAVKGAPTDSRARLELGLALQRQKRYSRALEQYAHITKREPGNTSALFNSGVCYEALERADDAETAYLAVLTLQPDHIAAARSLGTLYLELGRHEDVVRRVGAVADRRVDVGYLHYLVGAAYEGMGETERAKRRYRQAARSPGGVPEAAAALSRLGE